LLTRKNDWTEPERKMMRKAGRRYLAGAGLIVFIGLVARLGFEGYQYLQAFTLVQTLRHADAEKARGIIWQLETCRRWANPKLFRLLAETPPSSQQHLHASFALLSVDPSQVDYLYPRMLNVDGDELSLVIESLIPYKNQFVPKLWPILDATEPGTTSWSAVSSPECPSPSAAGHPPAAATAVPDGRLATNELYEDVEMPAKSSLILRVAAILAHYDPANQRWDNSKIKITDELVRLDPVELAYWVRALRPIKEALIGPLNAINSDDKRPPNEKNIAAVVLRDYGVRVKRPLISTIGD
jgi:hypothetical protein